MTVPTAGAERVRVTATDLVPEPPSVVVTSPTVGHGGELGGAVVLVGAATPTRDSSSLRIRRVVVGRGAVLGDQAEGAVDQRRVVAGADP